MLPLLLSLVVGASPVDVAAAAYRAGRFEGELLVSRGGTVVAEAALGVASRERRAPHVPGARWRWASVTKQVAAVLLMQEVERGTLSLDTPLARALPGFGGPTAGAITLRMLLKHTSGLPDPDGTPRDPRGVPKFYRSPAKDGGLGFCAGPPRGKPGAGFAYSNCDFLVLGAVLERATGIAFPALVEERIAGPLGLGSVRMAPDDAVQGYEEDGRPEPPMSVAAYGAAGALGGTIRDLARFDDALRSGTLLSPGSLAVLWDGDPALGYVALGQWSYPATLRGCARPVQLVERRGEIGGVRVANVIAPGEEVAVVLFSNVARTEWGEVWRGEGLLHDVLRAALCGGGRAGPGGEGAARPALP